jgi:hypothetical protein
MAAPTERVAEEARRQPCPPAGVPSHYTSISKCIDSLEPLVTELLATANDGAVVDAKVAGGRLPAASLPLFTSLP